MEADKIIKAFQGKTILVVGDIMLDNYIMGDVERISPEAPVPIVHANEKKFIPGGAANVANNISALGGTAVLVGVIGKDESGKKLLSCLKGKGIDYSSVIIDRTRQTIQKIRVIGERQQIVRIDYEKTDKINNKEIIKRAVEKAKECDIIVISDYAKGMITPKLISELKKVGKKIIVDPKPVNAHLYKNVFLLTPNIKEASEISGIKITDDKTLLLAGKKIVSDLNCNLIITRGKNGMTLFSKEGIINIPTVAREVYDVSGAGDTTVAALALSISVGAKLKESAEIANRAAGIVVGKIGTATVSASELLSEYDENHNTKLTTRKEIIKKAKELKKEGKTIVFTNGCFDILHSGHIHLLKKAKGFGEILIVGLNSDSSVRKIKGHNRPVLNERERAEIISSLKYVDYVTIFNERTPEKLIRLIKPDIDVKGGDYNPNDYAKMPEAKLVRSYGGEVKIVNLIAQKSTTEIINRILKKEKV